MDKYNKYKEALETIASWSEQGAALEELAYIARKALEPEFKPEVGKLYMVLEYDRKEFYAMQLEEGMYINESREVRPLTKQEWKDIGAPVSECVRVHHDDLDFDFALAKEAMDLILFHGQHIKDYGLAVTKLANKINEDK